MRKTHKKVIGAFGLVAVVAMTVFAAFLPGPKASALTNVSDTVMITVINTEQPPSAAINSPDSGDKFLTPDHNIEIGFNNLKQYKIVLTYTDENGNETTETIAEDNNPPEVGPASYDFRSIAERFGYGKYLIQLEAVGNDDSVLGDTIEFEYVAIEAETSTDSETGNTYVDLDFDQNQDELTDDLKIDHIILTILDENGIEVPGISPIVVKPPVGRVEIPFGDDVPAGKYTIVAQPYNAAGDSLFQTVTLTVEYDGGSIVVPSTADTGGLFKNLNISRTDYLVTGIGVFLIVGIGGIIFMRKHSCTTGKHKK